MPQFYELLIFRSSQSYKEKLNWVLSMLRSYYNGIVVPFDTNISLRHWIGEMCGRDTFGILFIVLLPVMWKMCLPLL